MQLLSRLTNRIKVISLHGPQDRTVPDFTFDSRKVILGGMYVAVKGNHADGHNFIEAAETSGAGCIVCETLPEKLNPEVTYLQVKDCREALSQIAGNFFDRPADQLTITGVTGTNGKTTVATLLFELFRSLGYKTGLISTVCIRINEDEFPAALTTPDPKELHLYFAKMVEAGCSHVFMEVSSHACDQKRIAGIDFKGAIFTNLTHDHLDYHKTFDSYLKAKKSFFDGLSSDAFALVNIDDRNGSVMVQNTSADIKSYSLQNMADFRGKVSENRVQGLKMYLNNEEVWFRLAGQFNAYNLTAVYGAAVLLGIDPHETLVSMSTLSPVRGRLEIIPLNEDLNGIVDYAHTPDALRNVLETIHDIKYDDMYVITVVGCGGDRDKSKRPVMARTAVELSDKVILTSDNPRTEDPAEILREMVEGIPRHLIHKVTVIESRKEAISTCFKDLRTKAVILVAGKGHETYQEINGVKYPFDDVIELKKSFHQFFGSN